MDKLFKVDAYIQRLVFYDNSEWEDWEKKELDRFYEYTSKNKLPNPE